MAMMGKRFYTETVVALLFVLSIILIPNNVSARQLGTGILGRGKMMGGYTFHTYSSDSDGNTDVENVANKAVKLMNLERIKQGMGTLILDGILSPYGEQIVAGMNYDLKLRIKFDKETQICHLKVSHLYSWLAESSEWMVQVEDKSDPCKAYEGTEAITQGALAQREGQNVQVQVLRKKRSLLGGEKETEVEDSRTKEAAQWAVEHINKESNSLYSHALFKISHATRQVVNGYRYRLSFTTVPTICRNGVKKALSECPPSNAGEGQDCEATVIHSLGEYSMETFKCAASKTLIGGDGHDLKPHGGLLGQDGHGLPPQGLLGKDGHGLPPQGILGGDGHDYIKHGFKAGLMNKLGKPRREGGLKFGSDRIQGVEHMSIVGGDSHDYQSHDSKCGQYLGDFKNFKATHNKLYGTEEEETQRFQVFCENMEKIKIIQKNELGTAKYGVTKFADLSEDEFRKSYTGLKPSADVKQLPKAKIPDGPIPDSWDWRDHGAVTPVKNQGQCGSCWAFSTTGNVEGQYAIKNKKLLSLSEQELVDCDHWGDLGCNGGLPSQAYKAIMNLGGLETESDYKYEGYNNKCKFNKSEVAVKVSGAVNISQDEGEMAAWLYHNGPISIGINAFMMQFYWGGISHPWKLFCNPNSLDHGVLIVGYGVEKNKPYWIVKNSWGPSWGRDGYYYVYRGDGTCGLNKMCTSATV